MNPLLNGGAEALVASGALMLVVLVIRTPVRRWIGPRLSYCLWALPAVRMIMPRLPTNWLASPWADRAPGIGMQVLFVGPRGALDPLIAAAFPSMSIVLISIWLIGMIGLFAFQAGRHLMFCSRLRRESVVMGRAGIAYIIAADVPGPLAFGVARRFIAVPRTFLRDYTAVERELVLAHERAHHERCDLLANWVSLLVLAAHWWNPFAWMAIRAFREDQEFAADAHVLAKRGVAILPAYAGILAKAVGVGALPASNLNTHSNLKGRLMMLRQKPRSNQQRVLGGVALILLGGAALGATSGNAGLPNAQQAVTIGVKPDGSGGFKLIVDGAAVAPGAPLPNGMTLPADFSSAGGCDLTPSAKPIAMVIKGTGGTQSYTVMCASAGRNPTRAALTEGLSSLKVMRASVAVQESPTFPVSERVHALAAIDRSIHEVEATLGKG
jgi:beta-lactamase regulating signal transducer with metallopeptidase domain